MLQTLRSSLYERDIDKLVHGSSKITLLELLDKAIHKQAIRTTRLINKTTKEL